MTTRIPVPAATALLIGWMALTGAVRADDEPIPPFVGDWEGRWIEYPEKSSWGDNRYLVARVLGLGGNEYEIQVLQEFDKRAPLYVKATGKAEQDRISASVGEWKFDIDGGEFRGSRIEQEGPALFVLSKAERLSPTLGRPAPAGAVALLDGSNLDQWRHRNGARLNWLLAGETMVIAPDKGGDAITRRNFGDCELHLEFRLPYEPGRRGQGRANSGLLFQDGSYEVQILDSYGLPGYWDECGALYKVAPPKVNMCAPPGQWQTYDVVYTAPRFDANGTLTAPATATVRHNGVLIHTDTPLTALTSHSQRIRRSAKPPSQPGPISLQDHGHPIAFRNIWVLER